MKKWRYMNKSKRNISSGSCKNSEQTNSHFRDRKELANKLYRIRFNEKWKKSLNTHKHIQTRQSKLSLSKETWKNGRIFTTTKKKDIPNLWTWTYAETTLDFLKFFIRCFYHTRCTDIEPITMPPISRFFIYIYKRMNTVHFNSFPINCFKIDSTFEKFCIAKRYRNLAGSNVATKRDFKRKFTWQIDWSVDGKGTVEAFIINERHTFLVFFVALISHKYNEIPFCNDCKEFFFIANDTN